MRLIHDLRNVTALLDLARRQRKAISELQKTNMHLRRTALDLAVAWRVSLEQPEVDIRDDLQTMIGELQDELARLEEHYV